MPEDYLGLLKSLISVSRVRVTRAYYHRRISDSVRTVPGYGHYVADFDTLWLLSGTQSVCFASVRASRGHNLIEIVKLNVLLCITLYQLRSGFVLT